MCVYLRAKLEVSSLTLTSFRQGVILLHPPTPKRTPKKPTQVRVKGISVFSNFKTKVVTNLNPFNSANNCLSLFLITDSVSLNCSSGLKKFKISTS